MKINYEDNEYTLTFTIHNIKQINMNLIYLFFDVNKNIIDYTEINDNNVYFLIKNLFKDLGVKQQYLKINMNHNIENNCFYIKTQKNLLFNIPINTELLDIDVLINYNKLSHLDYSFSVVIQFPNSININNFNLDKIIGKFIIKLFNNLKEYIERNIC